MSVKITHFALLSGMTPGPVHLVLSDARDEEISQVWITARFELAARSDDKLALIELAALDQLQKLIAEGIEAAKAPPG